MNLKELLSFSLVLSVCVCDNDVTYQLQDPRQDFYIARATSNIFKSNDTCFVVFFVFCLKLDTAVQTSSGIMRLVCSAL